MRYETRPSGVFPSMSIVVDTQTGLLARVRGRPCILPHAAATKLCDRLNTQTARRKICRQCRHLTPAPEIVNGRCHQCAT